MKEWLIKILTSKPAKIVYMVVLALAYLAAFAAGIAIPVKAGLGFFAIPIVAAVAVAGPTYYKAFKKCLDDVKPE